MPKRKGRRRKTRTHVRKQNARVESARAGAQSTIAALNYQPRTDQEDDPTQTEAQQKSAGNAGSASKDSVVLPKSFVVRHGKVGKNLQTLVYELRRVFAPNTALNLRERNKANMKDYVNVASPLGVTHIVAASQSKKGPALKIARLPVGPTLGFRVLRYSLPKQVKSFLRKPFDPSATFKHSPLVVLNNFDGPNQNKRHVKITALTIQAMFPPINVQTVKLSECGRVVLFNYDAEHDVTEFRHYAIKVTVAGASKPVKKILKPRIPNLGHAQDISETILGNALAGYATSDSEPDEEGLVELPKTTTKQSYQKKRKPSSAVAQNAVKLIEIGPRMSLKLIKIEDSVFAGEVQYHAFQTRTKEEVLAMRKVHKDRQELKKERKDKQEENVKRKREKQQQKMDAKKEEKSKGRANEYDRW